MKFFNFSNLLFKYILILIICISDIFHCDEIENFEYLEYKGKKTFILNNTDPYIRLYMEVNEIKSKTIYFYVYITDPTKINFSYQLLKEGEPNNFKDLSSYIVTNHGSDHTIYYKISKPKKNGYKLYLKIKANKFKEGQKITVESTKSITDIYMILAIVLGVITIIVLGIIIISFYYVYNTKRDKSITESNEDVIIAKVTAEDYSPIK